MRASTLLLALLSLVAAGAAALAQDETPTPTPEMVTIAPGVQVPRDSLGAIRIDYTIVSDRAQAARYTIWVADSDGRYIRLTRCDDVVIPCDPLTMRAEGVSVGDVLVLEGS